MIGTVLFTNQSASRPIADRHKASHFIPGIINQPIRICRLLPIIYLIARYTRLENQIGIAPNRVEWIVLYRPQAFKHAWKIGWSEMVERKKTACLFARNMQRHKLLPIVEIIRTF